MTYSVPLHKNLPAELFGNKANSLHRLIKCNVNVPNGFAIGKQALIDHNNNQLSIDQFHTELKHQLKQLSSKYLMVRSSAIGEDGQETSFAGQLDSFKVNNELSAVLKGLYDCWESLANSRLKTYEHQSKTPITEMGVIVQEMIEPEYAGVLFTSSPADKNKTLIEYVSGHGESLVQGEVTPQSIHFTDLDALTDKYPFDVQKLLRDSNKILKANNNQAQDIEWAFKNKKFYFVQSRDITANNELQNWSNSNLNENYPNKITPLLYSIAKDSYFHYYKNLAISFAITAKHSSHLTHSLRGTVGLWGQKIYYNISAIHNVIAQTPLPKFLRSSFNDFIGYQKNISGQSASQNTFRSLKFFYKLLFNYLFLGFKIKRFEKRVQSFADNYHDKSTLPHLHRGFHEFFDIRFYSWLGPSLADTYAMLFHGSLGAVLKNIESKKYKGLQNKLIQAIPGLISNQPLKDLWQIHTEINDNIQNQNLFALPRGVIYEQLQKDQKYLQLNSLISRYLTKWGYRCSGELNFLSENYIEKPLSLIKLIKNYNKSNPNDPNLIIKDKYKEKRVVYRQVQKTVIKKMWYNPVKIIFNLLILNLVMNKTESAIAYRERARLKQAQLYYAFKTICQKIEDQLIAKNVLQQKKDLFFLNHQEITRLLSGEEISSTDLQKIIQDRKKQFEQAKDYPNDFKTRQFDFTPKVITEKGNNSSSDNTLTGLPACGGDVTGRIVILETVHEISKLKEGDILVTKQTDPGWICAFPLISGLIVENGGMLSHGAIVAREFGIPAVVGVTDATQILKDQQKVRVDGDLGEVVCL